MTAVLLMNAVVLQIIIVCPTVSKFRLVNSMTLPRRGCKARVWEQRLIVSWHRNGSGWAFIVTDVEAVSSGKGSNYERRECRDVGNVGYSH